MLWYYVTASVFHIDVQQDPKPAIFLALVACLLLWVLVGFARRREVRRSKRDLSGWRSRQPPQ